MRAAVSEQHAVLLQKGRQVFVKALVGETMMDASHTWLDGQPLRPRVAYVLGSGSKLTFGMLQGLCYIMIPSESHTD